MRHENELARGQRARVRTKRAVFPHENRIVPAVEPKPVVGLRHDVHNVPPVPVKTPDKLQRREAVVRRVQHPGYDRAQVCPLQVQHEAPVQLFRLLRGRFAFLRSGPEGKVPTVQHAVLAGKHGRGHLIIGGKLPQHFRVIPALAQHRIRIRQGGKPAFQFTEKHARVLPRGQLRGKLRPVERNKGPVRIIQTAGTHTASASKATQTGSSQSNRDLQFQTRGTKPPHQGMAFRLPPP